MNRRKKIAAIVTTYFSESHANLIVTKFLAGFPTEEGVIEPRVDIVSMYMDQLHVGDVGMDTAREHGVEVYPSIRGALTLQRGSTGPWPTADDWEDGELAVDGVLLIAEHGDYPYNERDRRLYPRRHMFRADMRRLLRLRPLRAGVQRQAPVLRLERRDLDVRPRQGARRPLHGRIVAAGRKASPGAGARDRRAHRGGAGDRVHQLLQDRPRLVRIPRPGDPAVHGGAPPRGRDGHSCGPVPGRSGRVGGRKERRVVDGARRRGGGAGRAEEAGPQGGQLPQPRRVPPGVFRRLPGCVSDPAGPPGEGGGTRRG